MERNLTEGSVFKNIIYFSLPYLLSYFLQTLYGMADLFIIGQFEGVASTTAVSIGSQVMHMLTVMIVGLAMGATVNSKGKLTYKKLSGSSAITINSTTGKLTVKKGVKKGTYKAKIKISAAAKGNYKAGSKTVTVTVKVK